MIDVKFAIRKCKIFGELLRRWNLTPNRHQYSNALSVKVGVSFMQIL